jgi:hypothetical protein
VTIFSKNVQTRIIWNDVINFLKQKTKGHVQVIHSEICMYLEKTAAHTALAFLGLLLDLGGYAGSSISLPTSMLFSILLCILGL